MATETAKPDKDGYYKSTEDGQTFVALQDGFYTSNKQRRGDTFIVKEKGERFKWARPATAANVTSDAGGRPGLLDKEPKDILAALSGLTNVQLNGMVGAETAGKRRKGVIAAIEDELANRVGEIGGGVPGKQPEEKEPKLAGGDPLLS